MKREKGFSLIELAIVVLIVAILAILASVLYTSYVRKGRRADAIDTLSEMSLAEERYRSNNTTYGTLAQVWGGVTASTGGYYTLSISSVSGTAYTLTATATGSQANDTESGTSCTPLVLSASSGTVTKTPAACWPQ